MANTNDGFFYSKKKDGVARDSFGRLIPGGYTAKHTGKYGHFNKSWMVWLTKEVSKAGKR